MKDKMMTFGISMISILLFSCDTDSHVFDASGTFEARETIISSLSSGTLMTFTAEEGQEVEKDEYLGFVDTAQLHLTRVQLRAQQEAILSRKPDISAQLAALNEQLKAARIEEKRIMNLLKSDAATTKQLDDVKAQIDITKGSIRALKASLENSTTSIVKETGPISAQIEQIDDQINKSKIVNPFKGTVLTVYAEPYEMVGTGQPLYKVADLSNLTLRAFITGNQLPGVKLNQQVTVYTDNGNGGYTEINGKVFWISDKAEFTPKSIQTKDERANKVYAVKVRVKNDGTYKIGMYGEVKF